MTFMKMACAATLILTSSVLAQQPASGDFVPLVGLWRTGTDAGAPTITVDGTAPPKASDDHALRYFGAGHGFIASEAPAAIFPLAALSSVSGFSSGELRVQFKLIAGATDQTAGIAFNLRPDHSYLYARYNTKDGNVAIWQYEHGARTVLAHGELHEQLPFDQWHTLTVNVAGRTITANVNGRLNVTHAVDRDINGGVGLWTKADSVTAFKAFGVQR